ncbi:MAG: hypothetical protein J5547_01600, partial [Clostridia bacterium]|nr:hypothetical protein [Clostridia bacterium]
DIIYGKGISKQSELCDLGVQFGILEKAGSWFSYNGQRLAQGKDNVRKMFEENPELAEEVEKKIRAAYSKSNGFSASFDDEDAGEEF